MKIESLNSVDDNCYAQLCELDQHSVVKYGNSFSEEIWSKESFKFELPNKGDLSLVAFDNYGKVLGYVIGSLKHSFAYIHRFVALRTEGIRVSDKLMEAFILNTSKFDGCALLVSSTNEVAVNFYQKFGFDIVSDSSEIVDLLFPSSKPELFNASQSQSHPKYLMTRLITKKVMFNVSSNILDSFDWNSQRGANSRYFAARGIELHFVGFSMDKKSFTEIFDYCGSKIYFHRFSSSGISVIRFLKFVLKLNQLIKVYKPSVCIASEPIFGGSALVVLDYFRHFKFLVEIQAQLTRLPKGSMNPMKILLVKYLTIISCFRANLIRAVSECIKTELIQDGVLAEKIKVVPSRVDLKLFKSTGVDMNYYRNLKLRGGQVNFLFVGRLVVFKGLHNLFYALSDMPDLDFKLTILGDGPLRGNLHSLAISLGISNRIDFVGGVSLEQVPGFIERSDFFILPSTDEGFPRAMLEAMAMKRVVIASLVGGIRDIAIDGTNGFYFRSDKRSEIVSKISEAVESNRNDEIVNNAYNLVSKNYNFSYQMKEYFNLLNNDGHEDYQVI